MFPIKSIFAMIFQAENNGPRIREIRNLNIYFTNTLKIAEPIEAKLKADFRRKLHANKRKVLTRRLY